MMGDEARKESSDQASMHFQSRVQSDLYYTGSKDLFGESKGAWRICIFRKDPGASASDGLWTTLQETQLSPIYSKVKKSLKKMNIVMRDRWLAGDSAWAGARKSYDTAEGGEKDFLR